ncbi:TetR family transcriptional regulator [Subtercola lobariae]|uniref:Transcriptional regulator, TetR family protein n=1 Tax=Subtercola lobariae TaxID=1588641 RepID=A0A917B391_9MICO|nr:TetR family transcriptional regulator [Subtercola lobariae]GGF15552.1 putative transcriptional regulator, TetR family protein [Subtercola lobariae]
MRSVLPEDATTRARIRDTAIELFGRDGFRETTVRAIATRVGVSPGLVLHHFGSKDGLREACDDYILAEVEKPGETIGNGEKPGASANIQSWLGRTDEHRPWLRYIGRMLADGSQAGDHLFAEFVAYTERVFAEGEANGSVRPSSDPHMRAVTLTAYSMSALLLERQFARAVGATELTNEVVAAMALPAVELMTHGVYTTDDLLRATQDALGVGGADDGTSGASRANGAGGTGGDGGASSDGAAEGGAGA